MAEACHARGGKRGIAIDGSSNIRASSFSRQLAQVERSAARWFRGCNRARIAPTREQIGERARCLDGRAQPTWKARKHARTHAASERDFRAADPRNPLGIAIAILLVDPAIRRGTELSLRRRTEKERERERETESWILMASGIARSRLLRVR